MLPSSGQSNAHGKLNDMRCSDNALCLKSQITLGSSDHDHGQKIIPAADGGFIVCGGTYSTDGDFHVATGNGDEFGEAVVPTIFGGYAVACFTNSFDGDVKGNRLR
jgi:hypothetical protein